MATFYTTFWHVREFELAEATREEEAQDKLSKSAVLESMFANVLDFLFAEQSNRKREHASGEGSLDGTSGTST